MEQEKLQLTPQEMLEISLYKRMYHFQSEAERKVIKRLKVKAASIIIEKINSSIIDSATYLTYDKEGRILSRTTSECTTVGCLPYILKQEFVYENMKIIQMNDYTFKKKYKFALHYWNLEDKNKLSKFDWEDYTYNKDTVIVESGSMIFKYTIDSKNRFLTSSTIAKTNNQTTEAVYKYSDSEILLKLTSKWVNTFAELIYQYSDDNEITVYRNTGEGKNRMIEYYFNERGLLIEKLSYKENDLIYRTKIFYAYSEKE